jgi:alpha-L-fucosidase
VGHRREDRAVDVASPARTIALAATLITAATVLSAQALPPAPAVPSPSEPLVIAEGPFAPTYASFAQYRYPDWFRDAKLGIWAHWGPQAVPMFGDWYARHMYRQGHKQYQDHLEHYGHPSKAGWKDVIPLWKAEKWDPARLMALYKKAGARYFVSMGVHHDNFDLWDSKYHRWNAVQMGPHRDVVGDWQKAAKANGLPFGVSEHLGASFTWWQESHGADKEGPLAGVPYDGADPGYADLYHPAAAPGDKEWYSTNPAWHREWFARIQDLVDHYQPDLLYTDGAVPFDNETGRSLIAHLYNASAARHGGTPRVVYTCKQESKGMWVQDVERGVLKGISEHPWQTDTSIGDWFYNREWKYRPVQWVIHMLVDVVSKNGNLLINVVLRPDGSLDPEVETLLAQMADWIAVNGEAIYGTRPWKTFGEGPVRAEGGAFKEDAAFTADDVRFTTKGDTLYAFALGWPAKGLTIRALGTAAGKVTRVRLLGHDGRIEWTQDATGLRISAPARPPCDHAVAFAIGGVVGNGSVSAGPEERRAATPRRSGGAS